MKARNVFEIFCIGALSVLLAADIVLGSVIVKDGAGGTIPGPTVVAKNIETAAEGNVVTDWNPFLSVGKYKISEDARERTYSY